MKFNGSDFDSAGPGTVKVVTMSGEQYLSDEYGPDNEVTPNHSPDGFQAGYGGSGPAQLAFALVAAAVSVQAAKDHYQQFKDDVVAGLDEDEWQLDATYIQVVVEDYE